MVIRLHDVATACIEIGGLNGSIGQVDRPAKLLHLTHERLMRLMIDTHSFEHRGENIRRRSEDRKLTSLIRNLFETGPANID